MSRAVRRADDLAWVDDDQRVVVVRLAEPALPPLVLDGTAAHIWRLLDETDLDVGSLVGDLAAGFGAAESVVARDVDGWLLEAAALDLVRLTTGGEA